MQNLIVKYPLLFLAMLCFPALSADTANNNTGQTTSDTAAMNSTAESSATTATNLSGMAGITQGQPTPGTLKINIFNTTDLELTKVASNLANTCAQSSAPETIPANGSITITANACKPQGTISTLSTLSTNTNLKYKAPDGKVFTFATNGSGASTLSDTATAAAVNVDSASAEYNLKSNENVDKDDDTVEVNYFMTAASTPNNYTILVGSDPQAWRLDNGSDPNNNEGGWNDYIGYNVVTAMLKIPTRKFMIINGDITEFGRTSQLDSYNARFGQLGVNYYWGIGNHDYANNIGGCTEWPNLSYNACARNMVDAMANAITNYYVNMLPNVTYDWHNNPFYGSLAYAWTYGQVRFIQLQNYPSYDAWLDHWATQVKDINPSLDFLEAELRRAKENDQVAIINMHDYSDHFRSSSSTAQRERFRYLMNNYPVLAAFGGHTHKQEVFNFNGGDSFFGRVPVYNSGALYKGDFLVVDIEGKCLTATLRNAKNGNPNIVSSVRTFCYGNVLYNDYGNTSYGISVTTLPASPLNNATTTQSNTTTTQSDTASAQGNVTGTQESTASTQENGLAEQVGVQIATRSNKALCLAATSGENARLADCSNPATFFKIEERTNGYVKFVSATDLSLCLKTSDKDNAIALGACKGDNSSGDFTSMRLWLLPNNQEGYLLRNKYKADQCARATGTSDAVAEFVSCEISDDDSRQVSEEWVLKRDNIELQPRETSGQ